MCIIIDANKLSASFGSARGAAAEAVLHWVFSGQGLLVCSPATLCEASKVGMALKSLAELKKAGKLLVFDGCQCPAAVTKHLKSNDSHIVALALKSGARVLFTDDQDLMEDFTNKDVIKEPRGSIYRNEKHKHLLCHHASCGQGVTKPKKRRSRRHKQ